MNWFSSLPQWFQMSVIGCIAIPLAYRLIRHGFSIKFKAPGGAEGELDADNSTATVISSDAPPEDPPLEKKAKSRGGK